MSRDKKNQKPLVQLILFHVIIPLVMGVAGAFMHFSDSYLLFGLGAIMMIYACIFLLQWVLVLFALICAKIHPYVVRDYFETEKFLAVKADFASGIEEYNAMCDYVEQLKKEYFALARRFSSKEQLGNSSENEANDGKVSFMRREIFCDKQDYIRVKESCYEFLFELFDIEENDEVLTELAAMHNAWFAATEGDLHSFRKGVRVITEIYKRVPYRIRLVAKGMLVQELGFCEYEHNKIEKFKLVITCNHKYLQYKSHSIEFDVEFLKSFISYSVRKLRGQGKCIKPIFLVDEKMTQDVLKKDNSCLLCGASKEKDDTLFLELEYIEPEDIDVPSNSDRIRTVCWKCKRDNRMSDSVKGMPVEL